MSQTLNLSVELEQPSAILRKLTIKVPADVVNRRYERGLAEVQKTAQLKGFRAGQAPISMIRQAYGSDIKHRLYHDLIEDAYWQAIGDKKIKTVGRPKIEAPQHQHGHGEHDHGVEENRDFTFVATVEVLPEIEVKGYLGLALSRPSVDIGDADVDKVVENLRNSKAEYLEVGSGLVDASGTSTGRPAAMGDMTDISFDGGLVTATGIDRRDGMKGSRAVELGTNSLIEGFEQNIVGMRKGETKTFRVRFPKDYAEPDFADQEAEFTVTVNDIKEKKLPTLDDEFAKGLGYEGVADLRAKAQAYLVRERTDEADRKLRSDILGAIIEKNPFEVPSSLVESQTRSLASELGEDLKKQGFDEKLLAQAIQMELPNLQKRAENQVRSSLLLEAISAKEEIVVTPEELESEYKEIATGAGRSETEIKDFFNKNTGRKEDLLFRLRQNKTMKLILDKAKIKTV